MDCDEYDSPPKKMAKLDEKQTSPPWLAVLTQERKLEKMLSTTADFCKERNQSQSLTNQLFSTLADSFTELLNDNSVKNWTPSLHIGINSKCEKLVQLCVLQIDADSPPVLDALAAVFNPNTKFHSFNAARNSQSVPLGSDISDDKLYARPPPDPANPRGRLVDLINRFGEHGGFVILLSRFQPCRPNLTIPMIQALLRPFALCHELLTVDTIVEYFTPIVERVQVILDTLTDDELKENAKNPSINEDVSTTIDSMKSLISRVPRQEEIIQNLESLRIRTVFRFLLNVKDIPESIDELDYHFNVEHWNHLLEYFQTSWKSANDEIRGKMLDVIALWVTRYETAASHQLLALLWNLARSDEISTALMEHILIAHAVTITNFARYNDEEYLFIWLDKCVHEIKYSDKWALPALKQIMEIRKGFMELVVISDLSADDLLYSLNHQYHFMTLVINNLTNYMDKMRQCVQNNPQMDKITFLPDGRYNHETQLQKRLDVLSTVVKFRNSLPEIEQTRQIWECLVAQSIFPSDKDSGFNWFVKLTESDIYFDPAVVKDFFQQSILQLDLDLLTYSGMLCFKFFFNQANKNDEGKFAVDNLIGIEYLWRVVTNCQEDIARDGFELLNQMNQNIGSQLELSGSDIHKIFITQCRNQLQIHSDTISRLTGVEPIGEDDKRKKEIVIETRKMSRVLKFMWEYIMKCKWDLK